jgi:hypothetical protein
MNLIQVSENQIMIIWFSCLALLFSPLPQEDKIKILENALMSKLLENNQILPVVQTGLLPFDEALQDYGKAIESRIRGFDMSKISTGSEIIDNAFKERLQKIIDTNFSQPLTE